MNKAELIERATRLSPQLEHYIGRGGDHEVVATAPINAEAVATLTNVVGDDNPVYRDAELARRMGHPGAVAPPTTVLWWHRPYLDPVDSAHHVDEQGVRHFRLDPNPARLAGREHAELGLLGEVIRDLAQAGFTSTVVTQADVSLSRYPGVGDRLTCRGPVIESISQPKPTALGVGFFTVSAYHLVDQRGEEVARWNTTRLYFAPHDDQPARTSTESPRTARVEASQSAAASPEAAQVGQSLPPLVIDVNRTLIVAGAIATRDPQDVHHDAVLAVERGFKDIFINNFAAMALLSRYVTDWAGPAATVRRFDFRLQKPQYPDDPLTLRGRISNRSSVDGRTMLSIDVEGTNSLGIHITSRFDLEITRSAA